MIHLSTAATTKCSPNPWVKFQSALRVNIQSAPTVSENPDAVIRESYADIQKRIRQYALDLQAAISDDVQKARKILADLLGNIEIKVKEDGIYAEYDCAAERLLVSGGAYIPVVAGAGFEPTTFGL